MTCENSFISGCSEQRVLLIPTFFQKCVNNKVDNCMYFICLTFLYLKRVFLYLRLCKPWINLINTVLDIAHKSPCENKGRR